jgi:hypothetical protein
MLLRLLFVLPAFFFCAFQARAQAYEPGLLVTSAGDTLRGEIENGFWEEPPAFIRYRAASAASSQMFQPRQLRAVSFTGAGIFAMRRCPLTTRPAINSATHWATPDRTCAPTRCLPKSYWKDRQCSGVS